MLDYRMMSVLLQSSLLLAVLLGFSQNTGQRAYKILGALPIGSSQKDIDRFSKALEHYETNFSGTVDWALFHYNDINIWKAQPWYKTSKIVLSINEKEFAYYYFYKYLTRKYITNLHEYDWIWLMVSDCDFEVFDAQTFVDLLELWNPGMAQPANAGHTFWPLTRLHYPSEVRVTNLIEVGPLLSIRVKLWEDFRGIMVPEFNTGWGIDQILCRFSSHNHEYILNPFKKKRFFAKRQAKVLLLEYDYTGNRKHLTRISQRLCPDAKSFNPACLIVDASPLTHLNFLEGRKSGFFNRSAAMKQKLWYLKNYPNYFVPQKKAVSYCTK